VLAALSATNLVEQAKAGFDMTQITKWSPRLPLAIDRPQPPSARPYRADVEAQRHLTNPNDPG